MITWLKNMLAVNYIFDKQKTKNEFNRASPMFICVLKHISHAFVNQTKTCQVCSVDKQKELQLTIIFINDHHQSFCV